MDARLVWDTWRRILSDDGLVEMVTQAGRADNVEVAGLSAAEIAVVAEYARTPQATSTNIGMYRRGLVRIAHAALSRVPLSQHLLFMSGLDIDAVTAEFVRANGYVDYGPNFWHLTDAFIAYLATRPEFSEPAHQDVLALDQALVALAQRLGETVVELWPDAAATGFGAVADSDCSSTRFVASCAAVVAASCHDLTPWIENPQDYDPAKALAPSPRHWLIYLPSADSPPAYAELSERSARIFDLLAMPHTAADVARALPSLSEAEVLKVIDRLVALGVVARVGDGQMYTLSNDAFVMLDPAVKMLGVQIAEHQLLCHGHFEVGMAVPPGDGLSDFVTGLVGKPVRVGVLRKGFDDQSLIETMLAALRQHGFLHVTSQAVPSADELTRLRRSAEDSRRTKLCHTIALHLDAVSADEIRARVGAEVIAPELHLLCMRLADHAATLAKLASLRQAGQLRLHHTTIQTADLTFGADVVQSLRRLGAAVIVDGVLWPAPEQSIAGLEALTRAGVSVHALMTPSRSFLDAAACARAIAWAGSVFLTGLCLELDADALWPTAEATEGDFVSIFEVFAALEGALGDVRIVNLPSDEVLLGNARSSIPTALSDTAKRFRLAYPRWRLPLLKSSEGDNTFSQTPEAEEKLVRLQEDLLPNHPELLQMGRGGVVVDVCGGNGRVARRLSPLAGRDGLVISVELLRCVTDRARRFSCELGFTNLQFRTGLAQRIPLPDGTVDAAVNEWTGAIWQLGLGPAMVGEMARVVRPGGRIAVTHRLVRLPLTKLGQPWVQFDDIYALMHSAFARTDLTVVAERVWGQTVSTLAGEKATAWRKHYMPYVINPFDVTYTEDQYPGPHADVCLTIIAERHR